MSAMTADDALAYIGETYDDAVAFEVYDGEILVVKDGIPIMLYTSDGLPLDWKSEHDEEWVRRECAGIACFVVFSEAMITSAFDSFHNRYRSQLND